MDISTDKAQLRNIMREKRKAIAPESRCAYETALESRLFSLPALRRVKCIATYNPVGSEAHYAMRLDTLFQLEQGPTIAFPIVRSATSMDFFRFETDDDRSMLAYPKELIENFDIDRQIKPEQIDLMLIPGLAFDEQGRRLGQGGGYYDRYLPYVREDCMLIGIAFDEQVVESVPCDSADVRMNYVVTPTRLISAV